MSDPNVGLNDGKKYRIQAAFLGLLGGMSALFGFSRTLGKAKKLESKLIEKSGSKTLLLLDEGAALAMRALGWGTLYAVLGTGAFFFGVWKLSGAKDMNEFRLKMGNNLPKIGSNDPPTSTDFESLTDLVKYLAAWGKE